MTTDELVTAIYDSWGEDEANSIVSPAQMTAFANRAQRALCLAGNILLQCAKGPFVAGQETYNLPANYLKVDAVFLTNASGDPKPVHPIDVSDRDPSLPQGSPDHYWIWGEKVNSVNAKVIGFNDIPDSRFPVAPTNSWEVFYRKRPNKMVHSTEGVAVPPEVPDEFQDSIVDYCLGMVYRRLGRDFQTSFSEQMALWRGHLKSAESYVNPLTFDYPVPRRDTAGLTRDWTL